VAVDPAARDPVVVDPVAADPVAADPVAADPVAVDPVAADGAADCEVGASAVAVPADSRASAAGAASEVLDAVPALDSGCRCSPMTCPNTITWPHPTSIVATNTESTANLAIPG